MLYGLFIFLWYGGAHVKMKDWIYGEIIHLSWSWWWWLRNSQVGFQFSGVINGSARTRANDSFISIESADHHHTLIHHKTTSSSACEHTTSTCIDVELRNLNSHSHSTRRKSKDLVYFKLLAWIISHFISVIILIVLFLCSKRKSHKRCDLLRFLVFDVLPCAQSTSSCERSRQIEFFITQICLMDPKMKFAT